MTSPLWDLFWAELCPPRIHRLRSSPPVPQNVTVFGDRAFKEVIKVNLEDIIVNEISQTQKDKYYMIPLT